MLNYVPLLETLLLHLTVMIAKDSPLLIDMSPSKASSDATFEAIIAKFRITAYMWQLFYRP